MPKMAVDSVETREEEEGTDEEEAGDDEVEFVQQEESEEGDEYDHRLRRLLDR